MTVNWIVATFDTARELGILVPGFVGTYKDIEDALVAWDDARLEALDAPDPDLAYERHLECNPQYAWEEEQDRLRNPFDRQTGYLVDEDDRERARFDGHTPLVFS